MSALATARLDADGARRLTERIRITAHNYAEARDMLIRLVQEAKDGNAHEALGYPSWTAYLADALGSEPMRLARDDRQEMVRVLSSEGMSTRAIAAVVGVSQPQVVADKKAGDQSLITCATPVTGLDGKTYTPQATKPAPESSADAETEVAIVNDLRLYLGHIGSDPSITNLSAAAKKHIIAALEEAATNLKESL